MLTQTLKTKIKTKEDNSVIIYLLNLNNSSTKICGLSMIDWVKKSVKDIKTAELTAMQKEIYNKIIGE